MEHGLPECLVRRFKAVPDPLVRRRLVNETLSLLDPLSVAGFLAYLLASRDDTGARASWLDAVLGILFEPVFSRDRLDQIRKALSPLAVWGFLQDDDSDGAGSCVSTPYDLEEVPLGWRKARARGRNRDDLRRLAHDPDPSVIRILCENPAVTELDVLSCVAKRPQSAPIFAEVVRSVRFGTREAVQAGIVMNPWCPRRFALALLPMLPRTRLREVSAMTPLPEAVRRAAQELADPGSLHTSP